jgi:histone H3/H4
MKIKAELDLMSTTGEIDWDRFVKVRVRSIAKDAVRKRTKEYGNKGLAASYMALSGMMSRDFQNVYVIGRKNSEAMSYYNYMLEKLGFSGVSLAPPIPKLTQFFGSISSVRLYEPVSNELASMADDMYMSFADLSTLAILRGCSLKEYERIAEDALKTIDKSMNISRSVITAMSSCVSRYDDELYEDMVKTMGIVRSGEKVIIKVCVDRSVRDRLREFKGSNRVSDLVENIIIEWMMRSNTRESHDNEDKSGPFSEKNDIKGTYKNHEWHKGDE